MALFFQPYQFLFCFVLFCFTPFRAAHCSVPTWNHSVPLFSSFQLLLHLCRKLQYPEIYYRISTTQPLNPENPNPETTNPANIPHSPPNTMGCGMSRPSPSRYIDDDNYEQNVYCPSKCRPFGHHHDHHSEQPEHHLRRQDVMLSEDDDRATLAKLSRELDQREREHC